MPIMIGMKLLTNMNGERTREMEEIWEVSGVAFELVIDFPCGMGLLQCLLEEISDMDEAKSFEKKSVLFKQEMYDVDYGNFCKVKITDFAL